MSVANETTEAAVRRILEEYGVDAEEITPGSRLVDDLGLDSLDIVEVCMNVEDQLQVEISDDKMGDLETVGQVVAYVDREKQK